MPRQCRATLVFDTKMKYRQALGLLILIFSFCAILQYHSKRNTDHLAKEPKCHSMLTDLSSKAERGQGYYIRHCVTDRIVGRAPTGLQSIPFETSNATSPEIAEQRQSSFENIFNKKEWIRPEERKNDMLASGPGSTLHYAQDVIAGLHSIISELKRHLHVERIRMLDIPCGDMVWMSRFLKVRDDVDYTGFDIVPELINRHRKNYGGKNSWAFRVQDIVRYGLNESYDLILCRMMLQHLFSHDALTVVKHFSESGSRFLLTTSFYRANVNKELPGVNTRFRELNMELPPFALIPPVCVLRDGERDDIHGRNHFLGLWQLPVRRVKLCNSTASFRVQSFGVDFFSCTNWL